MQVDLEPHMPLKLFQSTPDREVGRCLIGDEGVEWLLHGECLAGGGPLGAGVDAAPTSAI